MPGLFERRLIFVTGKGGVGKSTVAIALGMVAARRGLRTIVAELASQDRVRQTFAQSGETFEEVQLADGLFTISIDPESAMEEYLRVKTGPVGQALGSSRLFQAFAMATPGMRELLSIGKVWELAQFERRTSGADVYDLVIVDSPAAGHGVGILRTPRTFAEIARVGPIAHQARTIAATIADREFTAVAAVSHRRGDAGIGDAVAARRARRGRDPARRRDRQRPVSRALLRRPTAPACSAPAPRRRRRWPPSPSARPSPSTPAPARRPSSSSGCATVWPVSSSSCPICSPSRSAGRSWSRWPTPSTKGSRRSPQRLVSR